MRIRVALIWASALMLLALSATPVWAQGGPGPRGRGPGGFGWGPGDGVQFLGMGGCFFGEAGFGKKSSTPSYELSVARVETRAVLPVPPSTTPTTKTSTEAYTVFYDNGVSELQTTRNKKT